MPCLLVVKRCHATPLAAELGGADPGFLSQDDGGGAADGGEHAARAAHRGGEGLRRMVRGEGGWKTETMRVRKSSKR